MQTTERKKGNYTHRQYEPVDYANYSSPKENMNDAIQPIQLEDAPIMMGRAIPEELSLLRKRVDRTIDIGIPVGKAMPIPKKSASTIQKYVIEKYPNYKFRVSSLKGDTFTRFIRII